MTSADSSALDSSSTRAKDSSPGISAPFDWAMYLALDLATRGPAYGVNPQVGCVILSPSGDILAEGWHRGAGTAHAEVDALSKLAPGTARGATAVVTLEPCNHTGRTGPCSEALIAAGITTVAYGVSDPNARAEGGAERLREAGVTVIGGVLVDEVSEAMHAWLTATRLGRPYVTLKWAASLDGRASAADGTSQWITGTAARHHGHEQRAKADAIVVGTGTVLSDNPTLTARNDSGELLPHQPIPIVIGERAIPADAKVLSHPMPAIVTGSRDLRAILDRMFARDIRHVLIEGGPTLASAFVTEGLVDEYLIYQAPLLIGGDGVALGDIGVGTIANAQRLRIMSVERLGDDVLVVARPNESGAGVSTGSTSGNSSNNPNEGK